MAVCGRRDAVLPRNVQKDLETSLRTEMKDLGTSVAHDMQELCVSLKHDMQQMKSDLVIKLGAMMVTGIAVISALIKLF